MRSTVASPENFSAAKQLLLEKRLQAAMDFSPKVATIRRRDANGNPPLSFAQQRLWFLDQLNPQSPVYNIFDAHRVRGELDASALEWSLVQIVQRHESLRTSFRATEGQPAQVISPSCSFVLEKVDLSQLPAADREKRVLELTLAESKKPFDLTRALMLRASLLRLDKAEHVLLVTMHHIASDAWSFGVFYEELNGLYVSRRKGEAASPLPELPIQYADFAIWQRQWLQGRTLDEQLAYWKKQLAGAPDLLELPLDKPRPAVQSFRGGSVSVNLPPSLGKALKQLSRQEGVTMFMTLLAGFDALLHRYSGQTDILVGSPIAGRTQLETEKLIGFFVNTLVLRTDLSGNPSFRELLQRVRETMLDAYAHQDLPLEKLVIELKPERSSSHSPLVQVMFVLQNAPASSINFPGVSVSPIYVDNQTAKLDLILSITDTGDEFNAGIEYNEDIFEARTITRMLAHLRVLLEEVVAHPDQRVSELSILPEQERHRLLYEWNDTQTDYPRAKTIPELFEEQVAHTPNAIALSFKGEELTYGQLNEKANRWAQVLRGHGVKSGSLVGLSMERSVEMVVSLLAILKAGGAYVSLDPSYPPERLALMVEDAQPAVILTQRKLRQNLRGGKIAPVLICVDEEAALAEQNSASNVPEACSASSLAYVSFTSGSTGRPKGVCIPHRAVVRLVRNTNYITINAQDIFLQLAPIAFDASTLEIWGPLLNGAKLVVFPPEVPTLSDLAQAIERERVTILWLTSGLFQQMVEEHLPQLRRLRQLLAGGDVLSIPHVKRALEALPLTRLINGYGPTENTTFSCCHIITEASLHHRSIPIGKPISNTGAYVLDENRHLVPVGVPGELYLGGDGLATGYLNRDELTATKFIPNPFSDEPGSRLYKTGDLVRWLPGGELEFLGRLDNQVKIRGFRVEPGEIENALATHPQLRECVVTVHQSAHAGKRLAAYFVPQVEGAISGEELREYLKRKLPDYMVPAFFISLPALPLNANGKVDRKALPSPDKSVQTDEERIAPRDEIERQLAELWERVLGVTNISIRKSFFELGGHSLLAVQLVAQIERAFGRKISVATVFQSPTVEQLASVIRGNEAHGTGSSLVKIQPNGSKPPLFLIHGVGGGMFWGYTNLSRYLGPDQPIYALKSRGMDGAQEFETIEEMASDYLAAIRTIQPKGPYNLGGYCFGGNVAYEMARQLHEQGEEVGFVALINCGPPNSSYSKIRLSPSFVVKFLRNLGYWLRNSLAWTPSQRREFIRWKIRSIAKHTRRVFAGKGRHIDIETVVDLTPYPAEQRRLWEAHIRSLIRYHPKPYAGKVTLFRSPGHQLLCSFDEEYGWGEFALGGVVVKVISGAHEQILEEPHVQRVAYKMAECLKLAQQQYQSKKLIVHTAQISDRVVPSSNGHATCSPSRSRLQEPLLNNGDERAHRSRIIAPVNSVSDDLADEAEDAPGPVAKSYSVLFEEQVQRTPLAVAVRFAGKQLSYSELNARANQLAHVLKARGLGPEKLAAVYTERSVDFAVAMIAVFKTGGAILPLDPGYPRERLELMLSDSQAALLISFSGLSEKLRERMGTQVVCLDDPQTVREISNANSEAAPDFEHSPQDLAYVIYTSGSTGKPKGVEVSYRALLSHNFAVTSEFGLSPQDTVLQFTPLSFDISLEEMLPSWLAGAKVVLRNKDVLGSISKFLSFVETEKVTILNIPTSFFHALTDTLAEHKLPCSVRLVIIGGETVSPDYWDLWHQRVSNSVQLMNAYGLTEASITSTVFRGDQKPGRSSIPIGRPIANTTICILDEELQPVPQGETGELFIGGVGLARGYRNAPELTKERFICDPSNGAERLYRTGDRARVSADGNIEFLGRADDLVKMRGFRIEPSEIENTLCRHPAITQAVVQPTAYGDREPRLVAYFLGHKGADLTAGRLIKFLQQSLPEFMIPSAFVRLEAFPLTPSGKVDRQSLPLPGTARPALSEAFVAPRSSLEEKIATVWREVLHLDEVGINDNFFDLGGHSLHAMQVIGRLRDLLGLELPVSDLFEAPTVARLSAAIESNDVNPIAPTTPVVAAERNGDCPLSFAQQRLWFLHQLEPDAPVYNLPQAIRLSGELNVSALERSFNEIIARHEVLRTTYQVRQGQPVQVVSEAPRLKVPIIDLSQVSPDEREKQLQERIITEARRPFALQRDLMLRVDLMRLSPSEHILLVTTHHIAADGWSVEVLWQEFASLYTSFVRAAAPALPAATLQYADYAIWQRNWLQGDLMAKQLNYWRARLQDAPALLELPLDHGRPAIQSNRGARFPLELALSKVDQLKSLGQSEGCTLFMTLLAGFQTVLSRYTGSDDIVVGTVIANRNRPELERLIGCFANTLVLRTNFAGNPNFRELLQRTRKTTLEAYAHQDLPFERLVEELHPARDRSYHPVFQVMLVLQNVPVAFQGIAGLEVTPSDTDNGMSKFDLLLSLTEGPTGLRGFIEYSTELFEAETIERFIGHFQTLLDDAIARPDAPVSQLQLLGEKERHQLLVEWNSARISVPRPGCIHQWFETHARQTPVKVALIWKDQQISYGDLNARANELADRLRKLGAGPGTLIGICSNRTPEMVTAILAVLKSGAAYVPMDPAYPRERLRFILEDAKAPIVLTESSLKSLLDGAATRAICLDADWRADIASPESSKANDLSSAQKNPEVKRSEARAPELNELAYVIFTSGSTGRPKGVAVEHRSVVSLAAWAEKTFSAEELDGVLAATSICFDLSIFEILVPLGLGGKIILAENALELPQLKAREQVRLINTVPSAITELLRVNGISRSIQTINLAGEPLAQSLVEKLYELPQVRNVFDLYGPTEATVYSTFTRRTRRGRNNIGRPLPNEQVYILDRLLQPVPIGVPGELFIGGGGLARGYLNQPELTAERFVSNPFDQRPGQRLYRTGDLTRYLSDGTIEYLGRIDHQVKIRGFRIELGEVEAQLRKYPSISEAVVVADQDHTGEKRLVGYVVSNREATPESSELRDFLKQSLPEYMVPTVFVPLKALPLSPNGKVDRKALPKPETQTRGSVGPENEPGTDAEMLLAEIWREVLGLERIGTHDNFFDLGGHSLMITRVLSRVREALQVDLPMKSIFEAPTIAGLALLVENALVEQINDLTDEEVQKMDELMEVSDRR